VWSTPFDPAAGAILIEVEIFGPMGSRRAWFVLDTGASRTTVNVALADELAEFGDRAHVGNRRTRAIGAGGAIHGYSLNLDRIDIMGSSLAAFEVVCEDVDPETLVDGLIGLDFLRTRILTIDGVNGQITLGP
jgi:predicted aspartyl protease